MKSSYSIASTLRLLLAMTAVSTAAGVYAQDNKVYIDPESIVASITGETSFNVVMENPTDEVTGVEFTLDLPDCLELVGEPVKGDRVPAAVSVIKNGLSQYGMYSISQKVFNETDGAILTFTFKLKDNAVTPDDGVTIKLTDIGLFGLTPEVGEIAPSFDVNESTSASVTFTPGVFTLTAPTKPIQAMPGQPFTVEIGIENSVAVNGAQFRIMIPEGFTVDDESFAITGRVSNGTTIAGNTVDGTLVNVLMYNVTANTILETPGEGAVFTFTMTPNADWTGDDATVDVTDSYLTIGKKTISVNEASFKVHNVKNDIMADNQIAYDAAQNAVMDLQVKFDAAQQALGDKYGDEIAGSEEIQEYAKRAAEFIVGLSDTMDAELESANEEGRAFTFMVTEADEAEMETIIDEMNAKAAELAADAESARQAANEAAYNEVKVQIQALQEAYDAAVDPGQKYYDAIDTVLADEIVDAIANLRDEALAAYQAVENEGTFEFTMDSEAILAKIDRLVEDAIANMDDDKKYDVVRGDVTLDGKVTMQDATSVQGWILNKTVSDLFQYMYGEGDDFDLTMRRQALAADVNNNDKINIADYTGIVDFCNTGAWPEAEASAMKAIAGSSRVYVTMTLAESNNGINRYALMLDNSMDLTAGQFDVILPEGAQVVGVSVAGRSAGHSVAFKNHEGRARVMVFSDSNVSFAESEGAVAFIDVEGEVYALEEVIFANSKGAEFCAAANLETSVGMIVGASVETVFDAQGRLQNGLQKGVNIVRNADGSVKKVIR